MELSAYIFTETFRTVCYFTLFIDIFARITYWFGAEHTRVGELLRAVSYMISYPFGRIFQRFVARHPFFDGLPGICGTVFVFLIIKLLP